MPSKKVTYLDDGPPILVAMDAGVYAWLVEQLEAKRRYQYSEAYQALVTRALISFAEAVKPVDDVPLPSEIPPKRVRRLR